MKRTLGWVAVAAALLGGCRRGAAELAGGTNAPTDGGEAKKEVVMLKEHKSGEWSPGLSAEEEQTLFAIATDSLDWRVKGGEGSFPFAKYNLTDKLKQKMATFVTLKIGDELRGCIGSLEPREALYLSARNNAVKAAMEDWRFTPVRPAELSRISVSVSILSPIVPIASLDEFKLGEHGIIIEKGGRRAVYLPEVAPEQGWNTAETLSSLSLKAGLSRDAWREDARFEVFSSVVISR